MSDLSFTNGFDDDKREVTICRNDDQPRWSGKVVTSLIGWPFVDLHWKSDHELQIYWADVTSDPVYVLSSARHARRLDVSVELIEDKKMRVVSESYHTSPARDFTLVRLVRTTQLPAGRVTHVLGAVGEIDKLWTNAGAQLFTVLGEHELDIEWHSDHKALVTCGDCTDDDVFHRAGEFFELRLAFDLGEPAVN